MQALPLNLSPTAATVAGEIGSPSKIGGRTLDVRVNVASVNPGETVCIVGSTPQLGSWNVANSLPLERDADPESHIWHGKIYVPTDKAVEYRYVIAILLDKVTNSVVQPHVHNSSPQVASNGRNVNRNLVLDDGDNAIDLCDEDAALSDAFTRTLRNGSRNGGSPNKNVTYELIVRRWETHIKPRILRPLDESPSTPSPDTPTKNTTAQLDQFGLHADGEEKVDSGWITREIVVQFQLNRNPIQIWKTRYQDRVISFKMSPVDINQRRDSVATVTDGDGDGPLLSNPHAATTTSGDDSTQIGEYISAWPVIEVAALNEGEHEFHRQDQFGHVYSKDEYIIFQAQMLHLDKTAYLVDFYVHPYSGSATTAVPEHIGYCYILPSNLRGTFGSLTMPITGTKHQPIGQLNVDYLVVHPLKDCVCDARVSYASYWKPVKLDVGHRGAGNARRTDLVTNVVENTIASFNHAARQGADLVEMDVHLSRDKVPVIYHDFNIQISMKKKRSPHGPSEHERLTVHLKDLTVAQLQMLKLSPVTKAAHQWDFDDDDVHDNQPFPTLQQVLECVDANCGVNLEIKCPMQLHTGAWDAELGCELNEYIDTILRTVLECAGRRYIVFSAFNPDVCTMVRLKQNKYPILFVTQGQTDKWEPYWDPRTSTIPMATFFALTSHFLGINVHAEDILKDGKLITWVKSHRLILFCWGSDLNTSDVIGRLKKEGVDGVIYDKIDELASQQGEQAEYFVTEARDARMALLQIAGSTSSASLFESSCGGDSAGGSITSEKSATKNNTG